MRLTSLSVWVVVISSSLGVASTAIAQLSQRPRVALSVEARGPGSLRCFEEGALESRIAYYGGTRLGAANQLRLELDVDGEATAELRVYRGSALVSRRRFEKLSSVCADRRDAIAVSAALALETAMRDLGRSEDGGAPAAPPENATAPAPVPAARSGENTPATQSASPESSRAPAEAEAKPAASRDAQADEQASTTPSQLRAQTQTPPAPPERREPAERVPGPEDEQDESSERDEPHETEEVSTSQEPAAHGGMDLRPHLGGRWQAEALPSAVWLGALGVELWLTRRFAIDLSGFVSTLSNSKFESARVRAWMGGGELFGCAAWKLGSFAAQGCIGAFAAACRARGRNYPLERPGATLLSAGSAARVALRWPDDEVLSLRLLAQGHVNLVRPEFKVDGSDERLHPFWLGALVGLDVIVSFQ